ncbi:hypothetical protein F0562_017410 [Nyssa sinensis]|uniref:Uncharacterized protein n=1 Tax=Nyssa sinensis TaxID=561372 RepID=A0A5J4ZIP0_9ASTE|nr:hypothetical protein F0562_017410 [Nyssa sinensis]
MSLAVLQVTIKNRTKNLQLLKVTTLSVLVTSHDHLCLAHIPQSDLGNQFEGGDELEVLVHVDNKFAMTPAELAKVRKCGVQLVFEQDANSSQSDDGLMIQQTFLGGLPIEDDPVSTNFNSKNQGLKIRTSRNRLALSANYFDMQAIVPFQFEAVRPTSEYDKELEDDHNEVQPHQASDCFNGDPKLKDDQSQNQNQNQPHKADHFDDISKSDCLIFQPLLVVQKENEKEDGFSANILHDQNFCEERLCTQITIVDSSLNMASKELDKKLELKERYPSLYQPINDVGKHDSKGKGQDTLPQHLWPMQSSSEASTFDADEIWEKANYKVEELEAVWML